MDPKQTPPQVGVNSDNVGASATGQSVFANAPNRFKDTTPKGDIIIPPSTPEKPKGPVNKKLIIGIVAAVIVAVVAVVLVITMTGSKSGSGSKSNGSSSSSAASEDVTTAFNKYANFIISGEASEDRIPSEDELENPVIIEKIDTRDKDFMDEAKTYFDSFYAAFEDAGIEDDMKLMDAVEYYKQNFNFLHAYVESNGSADELKEMTDNSIAVEYAKAKTDFENAKISKNSAEQYDNAAGKIISAAKSNIVLDCYAIDDALYSEEGEENEAD